MGFVWKPSSIFLVNKIEDTSSSRSTRCSRGRAGLPHSWPHETAIPASVHIKHTPNRRGTVMTAFGSVVLALVDAEKLVRQPRLRAHRGATRSRSWAGCS